MKKYSPFYGFGYCLLLLWGSFFHFFLKFLHLFVNVFLKNQHAKHDADQRVLGFSGAGRMQTPPCCNTAQTVSYPLLYHDEVPKSNFVWKISNKSIKRRSETFWMNINQAVRNLKLNTHVRVSITCSALSFFYWLFTSFTNSAGRQMVSNFLEKVCWAIIFKRK